MAMALRGFGGPVLGEEAAPFIYSSPRAIWFNQREVEEEADLHLLLTVHPLQQLKLDYCDLLSRLLMDSPALRDYLLDSVSD